MRGVSPPTSHSWERQELSLLERQEVGQVGLGPGAAANCEGSGQDARRLALHHKGVRGVTSRTLEKTSMGTFGCLHFSHLRNTVRLGLCTDPGSATC